MEDYSVALAQIAQVLESCEDADEATRLATTVTLQGTLELMHSQYPVGKEFYTTWLRLCIEFGQEDKPGFFKFFDLLLQNYPDYELISMCVDHLLRLQEDELLLNDEVRDRMEAAVRVCGADLFTGSLIWEKYLSFEVDEHEDLLEQEGDAQLLQASKERLVRLFHRALSLPLVGSEKLLAKCNEALESFCGESDLALIKPDVLADKVAKSAQARASRVPLELPIVQLLATLDQSQSQSPSQEIHAAQQAELVRLFGAFVAFEATQKDFSRMQRLYDRLLLVAPTVGVTVEYALFLLTTVKQYAPCVALLDRALRRHPGALSLHRLHVAAADATGRPLNRLALHYSAALATGFGSAEDYLDFYLLVANAYRRRCAASAPVPPAAAGVGDEEDAGESDKEATAHACLAQVLDDAAAFLTAYYPDWVAGWYTYTKFRVQVEAALLRSHIHNPAGPRGVRSALWEQLAAKSPGQLWVWQEAIQFHASQGELEVARGIFRKILHLTLDVDARAVARLFVQFEDQRGDLTSLLACLSKVGHLLLMPSQEAAATGTTGVVGVGVGREDRSAATKRPARRQDAPRPAAQQPAGHGEGKVTKKRPNPDADIPIQTAAQAQAQAETPYALGCPVAASVAASSSDPTSTPAPAVREQDGPAAKRPNLATGDVAPAPPRAVLVRNLPFAAPIEEVRAFLTQLLGEMQIPLEDVHVEAVLSKAGLSRGLARATFRHAPQATVALALRDVLFQGRPLHVELDEAFQGDFCEAVAPSAVTADPAVLSAATTVFLANLSLTATEDDVRSFFADVGPIQAIKINADKKTGEKKGTALVQFATSKARDRALLLTRRALAGQDVAVQKSRFAIAPVSAEAVRRAEQAEQAQMAADPTVPAPAHAEAAVPVAASSHRGAPSARPPQRSVAMFKPRNMRARLQL